MAAIKKANVPRQQRCRFCYGRGFQSVNPWELSDKPGREEWCKECADSTDNPSTSRNALLVAVDTSRWWTCDLVEGNSFEDLKNLTDLFYKELWENFFLKVENEYVNKCLEQLQKRMR